MNIIICGAGKVGFSISKQLSAQGHSITVVDQSSEFIQKIDDTQDVKGIVGRATYPSVLEKAGAKDADMIIAVTQNDETNMVICQVAYSIFKINKKIARIRGQEFLGGKWGKLYGESNLPIDVIISPELEVARSLQRKLDAPGALDSVPFVGGKVKVLDDVNLEIKPNEIYNLAAQSHVKVSFEIPDYTTQVDALGTLRILEAIRNTNKEIKFYQASTSELFGKVIEIPQTENRRVDYRIARTVHLFNL